MHYFIRLLHDKGMLLRCFTQNIDSLEAAAGLPREKIVAAHGNFDGAHCIDTGEPVPVGQPNPNPSANPNPNLNPNPNPNPNPSANPDPNPNVKPDPNPNPNPNPKP